MKSIRTVAISIAAILFATLVGATQLQAQTVMGTVLGTVRDPSGAVIPGTQVLVKNIETGVVRNVTTDDLGNYTVPSVPAGPYRVVASKAGVKTECGRGTKVPEGRPGTVNPVT